jgi:hypothetical protein
MTFLVKVGTQRLETTNAMDIDTTIDIQYRSDDSDMEEEGEVI